MKTVALLIITLTSSLFTFGQDCDLKVDKNGIKVYTCEVKDSKFKAIKSTFQLNARMSELAAALLDIPNCDKWQYKTLKAEVLKKVSDREIIYYTEVAAPVLTSNRDFVIQMTFSQNEQTKEMTVDLVSIPNYIPAKDGIVRVPFSKARWTVKPTGNILQVDYYISIDIGGSVPPWLVNSVAHQAPYETFHDLQSIIGNYKGKGVSFIRN